MPQAVVLPGSKATKRGSTELGFACFRNLGWLLLAAVLGTAGCTAGSDTFRPCDAADITELTDRYPSIDFDDSGVAQARLKGVGTVYHPQTAAVFLIDTLNQQQIDPVDDCGVRATGVWLRDSLVPSGEGSYWLYEFDWPYSDRPELLSRAPWVSGLAQGNGLIALEMLHSYTGDDSYAEAAHTAFTAFTARDSRFVTQLGDGSVWFQEYETEIPTFVLNGHLDALIGLNHYAETIGDVGAYELFDSGLMGLKDLLHLFEIELLEGAASAYDLIRFESNLAIRSTAGEGSVSLHDRPDAPPLVRLLVQEATDSPIELIENGGFEHDDLDEVGLASHWTRWISSSTAEAIQIVQDHDAARGEKHLRITTSGKGWEVAAQQIPAGRLAPGHYTLTFQGRLLSTAPTTPGRVTLISDCPSGRSVLAEEFAVRAADWTAYGIDFEYSSSDCELIVELYELSSDVGGAVVDFDEVSLRATEAYEEITMPASVWEYPRLWIDGGKGVETLEIRYRGNWIEIAGGFSEVPARLQGRNIHFGYHERHVGQLLCLAELTGDSDLAETAQSWIPLATRGSDQSCP